MSSFSTLFRRWRGETGGASALEFAIIAPALILLIFGIMQLGLAMNRGASVQWAADQAARQVMLNPAVTESQLRSVVEARLAELSDNFTVQVSYSVDQSGPVKLGRLVVDYDHAVAIPMLEIFTAHFTVRSLVPLPET